MTDEILKFPIPLDDIMQFCRTATLSENEKLDNAACCLMSYVVSQEDFWAKSKIDLPESLIKKFELIKKYSKLGESNIYDDDY